MFDFLYCPWQKGVRKLCIFIFIHWPEQANCMWNFYAKHLSWCEQPLVRIPYRHTSSPSMASCSSVLAKDTLPPMTAPMMYTSHVKRPGQHICNVRVVSWCMTVHQEIWGVVSSPSWTAISIVLELVDCSSSWYDWADWSKSWTSRAQVFSYSHRPIVDSWSSCCCTKPASSKGSSSPSLYRMDIVCRNITHLWHSWLSDLTLISDSAHSTSEWCARTPGEMWCRP